MNRILTGSIQGSVYHFSQPLPSDERHSQFSISDWLNHLGIQDDYCHSFLKNLIGSRKKTSNREFAAQIFAAILPTVALYSHFLAHIVNFYLDEQRKSVRDEIVKLINSGDKGAAAKVMGYVYEALRKDPPVSLPLFCRITGLTQL